MWEHSCMWHHRPMTLLIIGMVRLRAEEEAVLLHVPSRSYMIGGETIPTVLQQPVKSLGKM